MPRVVHIIGNGDTAVFYNQEPRKGLKLTCNIPPFPVEDAYGTVMVDFKMMRALTKGELTLPGDWILGFRPKIWMEKQPEWYLKMSTQVKEFYLELPKYASNYTDFNCGHMATHYACKKFSPDEVHMWGFDSIFDMNLKSCSDFYLPSPRDTGSNVRLNGNWRPIWHGIFNEFKDTQFVLHHKHDHIKIPKLDNLTIEVHSKKKKAS
jgi:hypothetical protein